MIGTLIHEGNRLTSDYTHGRRSELSVTDTSAVTLVCHEVPVRCSHCSEELIRDSVHDAHGTCPGNTWVGADALTCTCHGNGLTDDSHEATYAPLGWLREATIATNEDEDTAEVTLRTEAGDFTLHMYRSTEDGHLYLVAPSATGAPDHTLLEHVGGTTYRHTGKPVD